MVAAVALSMDLLQVALAGAVLKMHLVQAPVQEKMEGSRLQQMYQQSAAESYSSLMPGIRLCIRHLLMIHPHLHILPESLCCSTNTNCSPPACQHDHCSRPDTQGTRRTCHRIQYTFQTRSHSEPRCES